MDPRFPFKPTNQTRWNLARFSFWTSPTTCPSPLPTPSLPHALPRRAEEFERVSFFRPLRATGQVVNGTGVHIHTCAGVIVSLLSIIISHNSYIYRYMYIS